MQFPDLPFDDPPEVLVSYHFEDVAFDLPDLYKYHSDLIVSVFSPDYERKEWCGLEWRAIFSMIKEGGAKKIMLTRFKRANGKGLQGLAGFIELDG
ncbi:MAG: toll/interleukin-1 receptor domain-containing protein, partial [Saprospiraceae bacterium]|nr:toll/interleukin-1 receptor domain-containing protein [Saprospiraceae bacterium]